MKKLEKIFFPLSFFLFPLFVLATDPFEKIIALKIIAVIKALGPILFGVISIFFLFGVLKFMRSVNGKDTDRANAKKVIIYSVIGMAVAVSVWGLMAVFGSFLGTSSVTDYQNIPYFPIQ